MTEEKKDLKLLTQVLNDAFNERKWQKFHSPKNLTMTLGSEAGELLDEFRWLTEEESYNLSGEQFENVKDEIGDLLIVLCTLSNKLGIDPLEAAFQKFEKVKKKYPVKFCQGKIEKYSNYEKTN